MACATTARLCWRRCLSTATSLGSYGVRHMPAQQRLELGAASLRYDTIDHRVIALTSPLTPPPDRGGGQTEVLWEALFSYAAAHSLHVLVAAPDAAFDRFVSLRADRLGSIALRRYDGCADGLAIAVDWRGVATLRLAAGQKRNPLTRQLLGRMDGFLTECAAMEPPAFATEPTPLVRAVLIEAEGPAFSSGHHFGDFHGATREEQRSVLELCAQVNTRLAELPQVTVAAVAGACYAGGAQLAASCDLVFAQRETARFCLPGVRMGGFCHTPAVAVAQRVSPRKVLELAVLATEVDAEEAVKLGLANATVPSATWLSTIDAIVTKLASSFNASVAEGKRTLYAQAATSSLEQKYRIATDAMVDMFSSPAYQQSMSTFLARQRRPRQSCGNSEEAK